MTIKYYEGRFGEEHHLFDDEDFRYIPSKGDLIYHTGEVYKVMYVMFDYDYSEINVFMRKTIEEDF